MFDRFIRLARATKALREQRFEDALQLALDPLIAGDRRAEQVRAAAAKEVLARAQRRLADGDMVAARAAAERVRMALGPAAAADLTAAIDAAAVADATTRQGRRQAVAEATAAIAAGELARAEALLAVHASDGQAREWQHVGALLADRARQAATAAAQGEEQLAAGAVEAALALLQRAELLAREHPDVAAFRARLVMAAADHLRAAVSAHLAIGELAEAFGRHRAVVHAVPLVRSQRAVVACEHELAAAVQAALRAATTLGEGLATARAAGAAELPWPAATGALLKTLQAIAADGTGAGPAETRERWQALGSAAAAAGAKGLATVASTRLQSAQAHDDALAAVRAMVDRGELDAARAALTTFLVEQPLHDGARRELELLDQGCADLDRRLGEARAALRAGQLRSACTIALALHGSVRVATEARQLVADARGRMALVERGLDEVRVALHGRTAATIEGVRHCLSRLQALAKVQVDHDGLPPFVAAVEAEITALGVCERIAAALDRNSLSDALAGFGELRELRPRLLSADRLLARQCDLADRLAAVAELALGEGRLGDVARCAAEFEQLRAVRPEFGERAAKWQDAAGARRAAAAALVVQARQHFAERDLAEAERLVEAARAQWLDGDDARALAEELRIVRAGIDTLEHVETMTRERDFLGARQKLGALPATSPFLRTRIYDMKKDLAKAQGLEGAFLLRVDEGGEHLVLRGESITIGNVRQNRADLPVLANVAGRHASIRRSMSFHGGMQDTIVAEEGEVTVGGRKVNDQPLSPGDRVQLGPALGFVYRRPCARSLTVGLVLQSGFQVGGTDRVLLMKDRGRDGRILIGAGQDVHIRVGAATAEVEVYATGSGQIRVACPAGGTLDGVPWKDEHPLAAGQTVVAAGVTFTLLPWRPAA